MTSDPWIYHPKASTKGYALQNGSKPGGIRAGIHLEKPENRQDRQIGVCLQCSA
jgi:hypothetical protein